MQLTDDVQREVAQESERRSQEHQGDGDDRHHLGDHRERLLLHRRQRLKQAAVMALLVEKAATGQTVVRLKGGDPFVFGHGAEEGDALRAAGVSFEIVPGITSALAVPAYAGLTATHRDVGPGFTVISAHHEPDASSLDYDALAKFAKNTTLIILMGVRTLPKVVEALVAGGLSLTTPVATTQWGTHSQQRTAIGTLETIVDEVEEHKSSHLL